VQGSRSAWAAAGDLDAGFGSAGVVTTDIAGQSGGDGISALVLQPDGKIVAAGQGLYTLPSIDTRFALVRYRPDGTRDGTFGNGGIVTTDFPGTFARARALALQPDGKLLAAGFTLTVAGGPGDVALARYNANGTLDATFGSGGLIVGNPVMNDARAIVLTPDGKIVIAGTARICCQFMVARYDARGALDPSFGSGGIAQVDLGPFDEPWALVQQPDGKLVAGGFRGSPGNFDFALVRFSADGSLDTTFGTSGSTVLDFAGADDEVQALAMTPDGAIVAAGFTTSGGARDWGLARFTPDGRLDARFGNAGRVVVDAGTSQDVATGLAVLPSGKVAVTGLGSGVGGEDFVVAQLRGDGTIDPTFGAGGVVRTNFGGALSDVSVALLRQPDGKLVVGGSAPGQSDFALARYLDDPPPTPFDHLRCYGAKDLRDPPFRPSVVQLVDQFTSELVQLKKPEQVCVPVDENGSGTPDIARSLCCYRTTGRPLQPPPVVRTDDQVERLELQLRKPATLCRPCTAAGS